MSRIPLSDTNDWQLRFDEQDIRGYDVVDSNGNRIGTIDKMIVNTDDERVDAVVLTDGTEIPAHELSIDDGIVRLSRTDPAFLHADAQPHIDAQDARRTPDGGAHHGDEAIHDRGDRDRASHPDSFGARYEDHEDTFRRHHDELHVESGVPFESRSHGYRHGYESGHRAEYRQRPYDHAEPDLERSFRERHPEHDYGESRDAVRFGFDHARTGSRRSGEDIGPGTGESDRSGRSDPFR